LNTLKSAQTKKAQPPSATSKGKAVSRVKALYDFAGLEEGELRLQRGDIVDVYDDTTFKDWWKGEVSGRIGIFPSNYVEKLPDGASTPNGMPSTIGFGATDASNVDEFVQLLSRIDPRRESLSENDRVQVCCFTYCQMHTY
jgi:signal transducing adaptor molecule